MTTVQEQLQNAKNLIAALTEVIASIESQLPVSEAPEFSMSQNDEENDDETLYVAASVDEDECDACEEQWNKLVDEFECADTLDKMNAVHDKWLALSEMITNCELDEEYEEDMKSLLAEIVTFQKAHTPKPQPAVEAKPARTVTVKPKEDVTKQVQDKTPTDYLIRVLRDVYYYNPVATKNTVRVSLSDASKVKSQVNSLVSLAFPEFKYEYQQSGKTTIITVIEPIPTTLDETTPLNEAIRRVRNSYNLVELGLCDNDDEYDCAKEITEMLIDIAAEQSVDLTQPLDEYISFEDEEE